MEQREDGDMMEERIPDIIVTERGSDLPQHKELGEETPIHHQEGKEPN